MFEHLSSSFLYLPSTASHCTLQKKSISPLGYQIKLNVSKTFYQSKKLMSLDKRDECFTGINSIEYEIRFELRRFIKKKLRFTYFFFIHANTRFHFHDKGN